IIGARPPATTDLQPEPLPAEKAGLPVAQTVEPQANTPARPGPARRLAVPIRRYRGQSLWAIAYKETLQIIRDRRTLGLMLVLPVVQLLLFGFAVGTTVAHISTVVVDQSRDPESRDLITALVNTTYFDITTYVDTPLEARQAIDAGRSKVAIIIAPNFAADLRGGRGAQAQILIDGSDPNIAQTALFAAQSVGQARSARTPGRVPASLDLRPTVLYNPSLEATRNFVPGLIGLILQLVTVILTSSTIVRERERGTFEQLIVTPVSRWELLLGKLAPYLVVSFWNTGVILVLGYLVFGVEVIGSITLLMFLSAIFLTGSLGLGLLISAVSSTSAQAMQASLFTALPAFILSGFIFPTDSMPPLMRALGYLLPLTYFLRIIRGIAMKGIGFMQLLDAIVPLTVLSVGIFLLSLTRFRKTLE
ncbi:MAG: ABC transporter permease, partial [Chloroflexi bacterium]|nr:ABC transporter permease [Chloroflexota bacterium]